MKTNMMTNVGMNKLAGVAGVTLLCTLAGCASKPSYNSKTGKTSVVAPHKVVKNSHGVPNFYQVRSGDTLSKIAGRYNLDWREIARLNKLDSKHTIYAGQWLTLWTGSANSSKAGATTARTQTTQTRTQTTTPKQTYQPPVSAGTTSAPFAGGSVGVMQFKYPVGTNNPVVRRFGTATVQGSTVTSNGMWFSGRDGDAVAASRAGTVIHADNNRAKEATISIQHTDGFVSSYIYIKDAQVKAGDSVQAGQRIASMKNQAGDTAIFEFRIARNGVYVDPLTVLK